MAELLAPEGMTWVCSACGKRSKGNYGTDSDHGWDESCAMNAIMVELNPPVVLPSTMWHIVLKSKHSVPRILTEAIISNKEKAEEILKCFRKNDASYDYSIVEHGSNP